MHLWSDGTYRYEPQLWATAVRLTRLDAFGQPVPGFEAYSALDATVTLGPDEEDA